MRAGSAENAGHENAGHEIAGHAKAKQKTSSEAANVWVWIDWVAFMPILAPIRGLWKIKAD